MSENVLLGGCGDLGLRVAQQLRARGDQVWALRRQPPSADGLDIHWLQADLTCPNTLGELPSDITQVVYLPTPDRREELAYRAVFLHGLQHLMGALNREALRRVLMVSSTAVYGEHHGAWVNESTPEAPLGFNGQVLLEAEQWLAAQPVKSVVLRLAGLYGPGRTTIYERLLAGKAKVPREQTHWANRMHIDDAAAAVVHLLQKQHPMPLYLGVDETPLPMDVLYDELARLLNAPRPESGPSPAGIGSKRLDNARLRASGFSPRWPDARSGYAALIRDGASEPSNI